MELLKSNAAPAPALLGDLMKFVLDEQPVVGDLVPVFLSAYNEFRCFDHT